MSSEVPPAEGAFRLNVCDIVVVLAIWALMSQKFVGVLLLAPLLMTQHRRCGRGVRVLALAVWAAALFVPYDVRIRELSGQYRGTPRAAVRVVPYVSGMPAHTRLIRRFGEYYTSGCVAVPLAPRRVLSVSLTRCAAAVAGDGGDR